MEPAARASRLGLHDNSPSERAAALRRTLRSTLTRDDENEALWMLGVHYRPDTGIVRRHPYHPALHLKGDQP